ncbi:TRAP transporter small permease [Celeribacter neptunius]|uniref:TRAP transporter small permease protein n=1 Tax=Celeribacter neptunius TaxID=588602 RepID=A0A1I3T988_9RHOB|nr:TRAP transporter small permease [Celeribacter neptunius]SFJ67748.1 TRAP-type C4-dicarboxylate transport system, small permease component [Celeribacter neptunius]
MTTASHPKPPLIIRGYLQTVRVLAGLCMALIVGIMIAQVFARYVVGDSLIWAEELCRYLLIWLTFLVLGLAYSRGEFVALDFVPTLLSPRWKWVLSAVMAVPILFFLGLMAWNGYDYAARFDRQTIPALDFIWESLTGAPLGLSIRWVYVSVTVGLSLMALHVIADLIVRFRPEFLNNFDPKDAAPAPSGDLS